MKSQAQVASAARRTAAGLVLSLALLAQMRGAVAPEASQGQPCPDFQCTIPDGKFFNGKFVDHSKPWDDVTYVDGDDSNNDINGALRAFYFDEGDFPYTFQEVKYGVDANGHLVNEALACADLCDRRVNKYNSDPTKKAGYWMFENTCPGGIGGTCTCFNNQTTCDGDWWSDQYVEDEEYGDPFKVAATYTTGKICSTDFGGDPHFVGADGSRFDFSGIPNKAFALISDAHLQVNAFFGGRYGKWGKRTKALTWMRSISVMWGHHVAVLTARKGGDSDYLTGYLESFVVDGEPVQVVPNGVANAANGQVSILWDGVKLRHQADWEDQFVVTIKDIVTLRLALRPEIPRFRTYSDAVIHFNVKVDNAYLSAHAHGIVGQTFRPDFIGRLAKQKLEYSQLVNAMVVPGDNAEGFIDGSVVDYMVTSVERADCRLCRFARGSAIDAETSKAIAMSIDVDALAQSRMLVGARVASR